MIVVLEFSYIPTTYVLDDPSFTKYIQSAFWAMRPYHGEPEMHYHKQYRYPTNLMGIQYLRSV